MNGIDKVYIICSKENESKQYSEWEKWIPQHNNAEIFFYKWKHELTNEDIDSYYKRNELKESELLKFWKQRPFPLGKGEISLSINWIKVLENAIENNYNKILAFESDAYLFEDNFQEKFNKVIKAIDENKVEDWDIISIGIANGESLCDSNGNIVPGLVKVNWARCTDSFIISKNGIKKLLEILKPFALPIDVEMCLAAREEKINMYWLQPGIVNQASIKGLVKSSTWNSWLEE
jgi:GR25 family glycosyltransferase involved in LPS biosynthesis